MLNKFEDASLSYDRIESYKLNSNHMHTFLEVAC